MSFGDVLRNSSFALHLESDSKQGVIEEMIGLLARDGKLPDTSAALEAVMEREKKMSTGMQYGVAVPHGKTPTVDGLVTAFALKKEGLDFEALDGQPSRIFVMTVSTTLRTGPHIQYLAEMSRLLTRQAIREQLLRCESVEEIVKTLSPL